MGQAKAWNRKGLKCFIFRKSAATIFIIAFVVLWGQALWAQGPIHITFAKDQPGTFPAEWKSRNGSKVTEVYSVASEGEKKFLHADAKGTSVQIGYERKWALKEFPVLQWQWRAVLFPNNTNEHEKSGNDSVLGIYIVFGHMPFIKTIKYVWSDTLPVGSTFNSPFSKSAKIIVIRSGRAQEGKWVAERRDILADYAKVFGDTDNPVADGIAILTDSDNTNSHAVGDYGDMELLGPTAARPEQR